MLFIHIRRRNNGIASSRGGFTVAIKPRAKGMFLISICQCNANQKFNEKFGQRISKERMNRGQCFAQTHDDLVGTLNVLHNKISTGNVVALNLDVLKNEQEI